MTKQKQVRSTEEALKLALAEQPAQTDWEAVAADQAMTIALLKAEQPAQRKPVTEFKSPGQRWEDGDDHDSRSEALYKFIADTDFKHCGDSFCFKSGGDGDNGETLMFILDCWFAQQHTSPPAQRKPLTDEQAYKAIKDWTGDIDPEDEPSALDIFRAAEAAHGIKEKNSD